MALQGLVQLLVWCLCQSLFRPQVPQLRTYVPLRKPLENFLATFFSVLILPVPTVFLLLAFSDHSSVSFISMLFL